ncbi:MAG: NnrU family protein [Hyphomicrobiales bacterium]
MNLVPLILGLVLFLGIHAFTMNRTGRAALIGRLGRGPYRGLYSLVAVAGLVLIVWGYGVYRNAGMFPVWYPPAWTRHITFLLVLIAFILLAASHAPTHIRQWVAHPMISAVILWSLGHLLVRGDLGSMLMFGAFLLWGIVGRIAMARRAPDDVQGPAPVREPRRQADIGVVVIGVAVYVAFLLWLHPLLIGVSLV